MTDASSVVVRRTVVTGDTVVLEAEASGDRACCPDCGASTTRVHERYTRRALELPWRGCVVRLVVRVRRFCCPNAACARRTFAENLGAVVPRRARRTAAVTALLLRLVGAAGGEGGARLAAALGVPTSADTLLRFQRAAAPADAPTPRVLGVDDLSLRRGYTYATLLVDLETHRPVDLLDGREAGVLGAWLRRHPGVEVVARDRSGAYAEGARAGAPGATQVADRFHLLQNASAALDEVLRGRCQRLDAELAGTGATDADRRDRAMPARPVGPSERATAEQRAARVARWEQARALRAAGQTVRAIAAALAVDPKTARRLVASPEPPRNRSFRADPLASAALRPFVPYLEERWRTGCTDACRLFREIAGRGYCGSRRSLSRALEPWRGAGPPVPGARRRRSARWLLLRPPAALSPAEREALGRLLAAHPDLAAAHGLVQRFRALVADRAADRLDAWLDEAGVSGLAPFEALAVGLATDRLAVDAALHLRWSTGPVEGHVHRVKLLKRRGYGRAKLDLLRARVLAA